MKDILVTDYQNCVEEMLIRNRSILDILSKFNMTESKVGRAVCKAVTHCGCISIEASKSELPDSLEHIPQYSDSHLRHQLCDTCKQNIEKELGEHLFYFAALCNALDIDMYDIILKEKEQLETLGKFNMR